MVLILDHLDLPSAFLLEGCIQFNLLESLVTLSFKNGFNSEWIFKGFEYPANVTALSTADTAQRECSDVFIVIFALSPG